MRWQEVIDDPNLKDLPFKIEVNEYGKILMSPQKVYHSAYQGKLSYLLQTFLKTGETLSECAILTEKGVRVADVAWVSNERFQVIQNETACSIVPEICIEITSASNSEKEMQEKKELYFAQNTNEFWLCNEKGKIKFYDENGEIEESKLVPNFPKEIKSASIA